MTAEHFNLRHSSSFANEALAQARALLAEGKRWGPLSMPGTNITLNVYVGCEPGRPSLVSLAPIGEVDGMPVWVGVGEPKERP